jgi:putative peptide zinc metalloprotease protein
MEQNPPQSIQLRTDLEFSRQQQQGKAYVVVKDPVTSRYFRFTEAQAAILELLHAPTDAAAVAAEASAKLGATLSTASVEGFFKSLEDKNLLDTPRVRETLADLKSRKAPDQSILYRKLASLNPAKVFDWLLPRTGWMFTTGFQVFAVLMIITGLTLNYLHIDRLAVGVTSLFNLHGLFFLWLVTFTVSTIHEFAHGLTCCHFGGKVKEMGFMLIYFNPALYCDVSDSWMFPDKKQRMLVTFAGGYFQLVIWGLATVVWRVTEPDTFINQIALVINVFAGLQTLFNFNPLIKLDGYYMLSDYLEIPRSGERRTLSGRGVKNGRRLFTERRQLYFRQHCYCTSTQPCILGRLPGLHLQVWSVS